jgi:choline-phosphate cytidylyltransferase
VQDAPWIIDAEFLDKWQIDYVAHDEDPYAAVGHEDVYAFVKSQGSSSSNLQHAGSPHIYFKGKFIPTRRTPGVSTSELLERIVSGYRNRHFDDKLTKMGRAELRAAGSDYDDQSSRSMSPFG